MNSPNDTLESMIADETAYHGPQTQLWAAALEKEQGTKAPRAFSGRSGRKLPPARTLAIAATLVLSVGVVGIVFSSLTRMQSPMSVASSLEFENFRIPESAPIDKGFAPSAAPMPGGLLAGARVNDQVQSPTAPAVPEPAIQDRHVIRKATMDLLSPDVRGTYAKVAQLINEGAGEFIEGASFSGEGAAASAQITLRVTAQRMGEVMMKLGSLAKVTSQQTTGQDVTEQVVDIEARIRNERRVETELLELLSSRKDASLKEVLELREQVSTVRERIERLTAQRETLGRLTSLASIVITIRAEVPPAPAPTPGPQTSRWEVFGTQLSAAWDRSLDSLSQNLIGLVEFAVSGLLVWVVLAVGVIGFRFAWRASARQAAAEPAPRV